MPPLSDHPLRYDLANELHARPFPLVTCPGTVAFVAIKHPTDAAKRDRSADRAHLVALLDRHGAAHPPPEATHHACQIGRHLLKWEQHTEFVTYTALCSDLGARAFDPAEFDVFPPDWLAQAPGQRVTSALMRLEPHPGTEGINTRLSDWFVSESLATSNVLDNDATVAADFRIDPAGHLRFAIFVMPHVGQLRIGRIVQRLAEIEIYKSMSMLGFSRVRELSAQIGQLDTRLSALMVEMTTDTAAPERTLPPLLSLSAELEALAARAAFRFGATAAYEAIVNQRIAVLRESRFDGRQTFAEFMMRRYEPAMRTVKSTENRIRALSDRAMRAGELLRTRVDVARSAENQALLASMDRRADLQLRLQHTVEGLSVVAVSYYAVSLASYLVVPFSPALGLSKPVLTALITLPVMGAVWWALRRIRRRIE